MSIGTVVYHSQVASALPAGVPPESVEAARDTLGGAIGAANKLPDQLGAELLDAAREAFTQGLQLAAVISAAILLGMAIFAVVLLRHARTGSEPDDQSGPEPDATNSGSPGFVQVRGPAALAPDESCSQEDSP